MDITSFAEAIITIAVTIITYFVIPWIKANTNEKTLATAYKWVKIAVKGAEMIYSEMGMGLTKKAYVKSFLAEKGFIVDEEAINAMIESAVLEMQAEVSK